MKNQTATPAAAPGGQPGAKTIPFTCTYRFCGHATGRWWISIYGVVGCQDCNPSEPGDPRIIATGDKGNAPLVLVGRTSTPAVWPLQPARFPPEPQEEL